MEDESIYRKRPQDRYADLSIYTFGKIPPQARDMEEAVLGACMLEKEAVTTAMEHLKPDYFYVNAHRLVFSAIVRLFGKNEAIDILTVTEDLRANSSLEEVGGPFFITDLTNRLASGAHVESHAKIVKQKWIQRERIKVGSNQIKDAYEDISDPIDAIGDDINNLSKVLNEISVNRANDFATSVDDAFTQMAIAHSKTGDEKYRIGLSTGVYPLDKKTLGFNKPDFVLIAGRPGHGKTTLAVISALHNAKEGHPEGIFSMEMSEYQIILKMAALETGISLENIRLGNLTAGEWDRLSDARKVIRELPIYIYDKRGITMAEASAVAKGWKAKYGVEKISFDYVQLIKHENFKLQREAQVSDISRSLKQLAGDINCPVVAVAALSRELERRTGWDKRPKDSDLREGGSLEYDPDMIIFSFRPENVGLKSFDDNHSTSDVIELIVSKNRLGSRGTIRQYVDNGTGQLSDYKDEGLQQSLPFSPKAVKPNYKSDNDDSDKAPF